MALQFEISDSLQHVLDKLTKRDHALAISVRKKIDQIIECDLVSIQHFKNLKHDLSHLKRVQIGSFVLVFQVKAGTVIFEDFDHHDRIYKKKF